MTRLLPFLLAAVACVPAGCGPSPEDAYAAFVDAAREGEWETVYGMLDEASQAALDERLQALVQAQADSAEAGRARPFDGLAPSALFARLADRHPSLYQAFDVAGYTVFDTQVTGDQASLTVEVLRGGEPVPAVVRLRREAGVWKVAWP